MCEEIKNYWWKLTCLLLWIVNPLYGFNSAPHLVVPLQHWPDLSAQHSTTDSPVAQPVRERRACELRPVHGAGERGSVYTRRQNSGASLIQTWLFVAVRLFLQDQYGWVGCHATLKQAICNCLVTLCFPWVTGSARDPFAILWRYGFMHYAAPCSLRVQVSELAVGTVEIWLGFCVSHLSWSQVPAPWESRLP